MRFVFENIQFSAQLSQLEPANVSAPVPSIVVFREGIDRLPLVPNVAHEYVSADCADLSLATGVRVQDLVLDTDKIPAARLQVNALCNGG